MKIQQQSLDSTCVFPMPLGHRMQVDPSTLSDKLKHKNNTNATAAAASACVAPLSLGHCRLT